MKSIKTIIKEWNETHDTYATIDRHPEGFERIIMVKDNHYVILDLIEDVEVTMELLEELYEEGYRKKYLSDGV